MYVAAGHYDLATPYHAAHYTINHTFQLKSMHARIEIGHFDAGHMMFLHGESLKKLKSDLATFIPRAAQRRRPE